jgi:hypothetical protein
MVIASLARPCLPCFAALGILCSLLTGCYELNPAASNHVGLHIVKSCNIEGMQSATAQGWSSQPGRIVVRGWAYDGIQNTVPGVVRVQLSSADGAVVLLSQAATRVERLDVANHFKDTRLLPSGFDADSRLQATT